MKKTIILTITTVILLACAGCAAFDNANESVNEECSSFTSQTGITTEDLLIIDDTMTEAVEQSIDTTCLDDILVACCNNELSREWNIFKSDLEQAGYTVNLSEGQYWIKDVANGESYIYGDISNETGIDRVVIIGYHFICDRIDRTIEVRFIDEHTNYYYEVSEHLEGKEASNLDFIRNWLLND